MLIFEKYYDVLFYRKMPFERPRRRWEDNIRLDLRETEWNFVVLMHLTQDRDQ
jgi:hypothetical protein